jgi:hypothetical protein
LLAAVLGQLQPCRPQAVGTQHQMERGKADPARVLQEEEQRPRKRKLMPD